jgi:hypothetical protein
VVVRIGVFAAEQPCAGGGEGELGGGEDRQCGVEPEGEGLAEEVGAESEAGEQGEHVEAHRLPGALGAADVGDDADQQRLGEVVAQRDDQHGDRADQRQRQRYDRGGAGGNEQGEKNDAMPAAAANPSSPAPSTAGRSKRGYSR